MINPDNVYHVLPVDDLRPHKETLIYPPIGMPYSDCECQPTVLNESTDGDGLLVVHNSFDGREKFEPDNKVREN